MNSATHDSQSGELYCPACERNYATGAHCPEDGTRLVRLKTAVDPLLGRSLDGRYTIIEKLGQGGMGAVYRGTQHSVGREIAIKVISAHLVSDRDAIKRFLREAKLASRLSHPNAVSVLEFGQTDDGLLYLVMELVSGRTLDAVIKREGVLKPERIVRIGSQVCDALEGAHALQIVHRDLKPANIMLLAQGRDLVKVLDFGLAKSVAPDQASTTMTNAGALLGTPAYMPPELALGGTSDARSDLYSLGVILYLLGTGRLPFVSDSPHELIAMHGHEPAPRMTGVPPALAAVVDRLLEKDPAKRFQSAAEMREALEESLGVRVSTPVLGTQFVVDTSPSLGPFPASSNQFASLRDTPVPPARSATEIERLVNSDTIASNPPTATTAPDAPRRSRRGLAIVLGLVAAAAIGAGVFVMVRKGHGAAPASQQAAHEEAHAAAPPSVPAAAPPAAPVTTAPPPPPTPPTAEVPPPAPVPEPSAIKAADKTVNAVDKTGSKADKRTQATGTAKSKDKQKQTPPPVTSTVTTTIHRPTSGINPTVVPVTPPTTKSSGSGSDAPPPF